MTKRTLAKSYRSGVFYFFSDKSVMILPTKFIVNEKYIVGSKVRIKPSAKKEAEDAEVIALGGK